MAEEQIMCVLCHMEEKKERIVNRLVKRRIPADLWDYFLETPGHMDLRFAFPPDKRHPLISNYSFKALRATPDKEISSDFLGIISAFVEATKKNAVNPNGENVNNLQTKETKTVPSREETEEEKKERKRQQLVRRKVPSKHWDYYLNSPELWNFEDVNEDGLQKGINAILIAPHTVVPCWVKKESINKFIELKLKMTAVIQILAEVKSFAEEPMLAAERKQAQKRADILQADLLSSCDDLRALTVITDDCFRDNFCDNISMFIETTMKNEKARNKVQQMKTRL